MAEARKSNISPPIGAAASTGNSGESGFHPQQMHQPFSYRVKYQIPTGLPQQRPHMVYDQHSMSQQPGTYAHHSTFHQFPHQQQLQQQQHLQQQQQMHQQLQQLQQQQQIHFAQQPENVQQSMQYLKDEQKSSQNQSQQNMNTSEEETSEDGTQGREYSLQKTTTAPKSDNGTGDEPVKEDNPTSTEADRLAKELEAVRAAHEKQVKDLEAQIKALHEQKSEKEVKYLRVPSSIKKREAKKSPPGKSTRRRSTLDDNQLEDIDTSGGLEHDGFVSCPSPAMSVHSDVSIKEEPEDDDNQTWKIQGVFPHGSKEKDVKASIDEEPPITYTLSVTDFDFCIFCQKKAGMKLVQVTEDKLAIIESIVLNVECEAA